VEDPAETRFIQSFKSFAAQESFTETQILGRRYRFEDLLSTFLLKVRDYAGAALGALRIGLLALMLVVVFDRVIPPGHDPAFLKGSQWRPVLSSAAEGGLQRLPPEIQGYVDRLKRHRRL